MTKKLQLPPTKELQLPSTNVYEYVITYRCDQEEYYCTDDIRILSHCYDVVLFVEAHQNDLSRISTNNTIIKIERVI